MSTFTLYPSNGIRMVVNTSGGAIMSGQTIANNQLYAASGEVGYKHGYFEQPWLLDYEAFLTFYSDYAGTFYAYLCDESMEVLAKTTFTEDTNRFYADFAITTDGRVYISLESVAIGGTLVTYEAKSEPIVLVDEAKEIRYWNNVDTDWVFNYNEAFEQIGTGRTFVEGKYVANKKVSGERNETYSDSKGQRNNILSGYYKQRKLLTDPIPEYLHDILMLAFQHHNVEIDGEAVTQEAYEVEDDEEFSLTNATITVQVNGTYIENIYQV